MLARVFGALSVGLFTVTFYFYMVAESTDRAPAQVQVSESAEDQRPSVQVQLSYDDGQIVIESSNAPATGAGWGYWGVMVWNERNDDPSFDKIEVFRRQLEERGGKILSAVEPEDLRFTEKTRRPFDGANSKEVTKKSKVLILLVWADYDDLFHIGQSGIENGGAHPESSIIVYDDTYRASMDFYDQFREDFQKARESAAKFGWDLAPMVQGYNLNMTSTDSIRSMDLILEPLTYVSKSRARTRQENSNSGIFSSNFLGYVGDFWFDSKEEEKIDEKHRKLFAIEDLEITQLFDLETGKMNEEYFRRLTNASRALRMQGDVSNLTDKDIASEPIPEGQFLLLLAKWMKHWDLQQVTFQIRGYGQEEVIENGFRFSRADLQGAKKKNLLSSYMNLDVSITHDLSILETAGHFGLPIEIDDHLEFRPLFLQVRFNGSEAQMDTVEVQSSPSLEFRLIQGSEEAPNQSMDTVLPWRN